MSEPEPKPRARARRALRVLTWAVVVLTVAVVALGWRINQGPVALPDWTVARIENRIARDLAPSEIALGEVAVYFDAKARAVRLALQDAALQKDGVPVIQVPAARVALDAAALMSGRIRPRSLAVDGVQLDVRRDVDGAFSLAFGAGGGDLPATWAEGLTALDDLLASPILATLSDVTVEGVEVRLDDALTGLRQDTRDGLVSLRKTEDETRLTLTTLIDLGADAAKLAVGLRRSGTGQGATATVALSGVTAGGLSALLPNIPALTLIRGEVSLNAAMSLSETGEPGPLQGRMIGQRLEMIDEAEMALDRAVVAFDWLPGSGRIGLSEVAAGSDDIQMQASGQILLEDGLVGPAQLQLALGRTILDPDGLLDRRIEFDSGVIETRLTQSPLALRIGQVMVTGPSGTARLEGGVNFDPAGLSGNLRLSVPEMSVSDLVALWPPRIQVQARTWFTNNMLGGEARNATALLRFRPGAAPEVAASFDFTEGSFRYMRFMPPSLDAAGGAALFDNRLTLRVDSGRVAVTDEAGQTGDIDVSGTVFSILDTTKRPSTGELLLEAEGEIGDMLVLLDNRPFRLLQRLNRTRDFAQGRAAARVAVSLPLRRGNAPADIAYDVTARLSDVTSRDIVPGRTITARDLTLTLRDNRVQVAGDAALEGMPFSGRWFQDLPPPATEPIDPDAPPKPAVPLPSPGQVVGTARVTPEGLARLGISVPALNLTGRADVDVALTLPQGAPPRLTLRSDLRGLRGGLAGISWTKPAERAAAFEIEATLGGTPDITRVALDAPGLSATGRISLRTDGNGLDRAVFDRVDTGWLQGAMVLTGRGAGRAPAISVTGGRADLRRALLAGGGGEAGGEAAPLDIALDRLTITEGIALTNLRATLRGGAGQFTGRINGAAAVEGVLAPQNGSAAVQVRSADAGGVLRSAGVFEDARGGTASMTLRPTGQAGVFAGQLRMADLRVRNAPALASLLQTLSVVGILEQLDGEGLFFETVESDFTLRPEDILVSRASAVGPSMSITADGSYDLGTKQMAMQGVISPIYLVNGLFGALFSRRDEGLFGFSYTLTGPAADPDVDVNPLSILTPGIFRDIFRRAPPS